MNPVDSVPSPTVRTPPLAPQLSSDVTVSSGTVSGVASPVNQQQVDAVLLADLSSSKTRDCAVSSTGLPQLASPSAASSHDTMSGLNAFVALPSPAGMMLALITEQSAEQRRVNKEMMMAEVKATVADMQAEAQKMVTKAVVSLVMGVVSSAVSIASGSFSLGTLSTSMKSGVLPKDMQFDNGKQGNLGPQAPKHVPKQSKQDVAKIQPEDDNVLVSAELKLDLDDGSAHRAAPKSHGPLDSGQTQVLAVRISAMESMFSGAASVLKGIGDATAGFMDSDIQRDEAAIETERAMRDSLQASTESLNDLIRKAMETYDSIQQNMNQTRAKILS